MNKKIISPRSNIIQMNAYEPPIEKRSGKLRLDFNENTIGCSPKVLAAMKNLTVEDFAVYPEYDNIKEDLANYLQIDPQNLILTNGTDEAIKLIMDTYLEKTDELILPSPTFTMFEIYASIVGCQIKKVLYNSDLSFPTQQVIEAISEKTKLIILVNPNNPTGTSISDEDIIKIIEKAQEKEILVFIDEAYYQFYGKSSISLINSYSNVIITQTFSKAFGLAGIRLGYAISDPDNIQILKKVLSPYSVNRMVAIAAKAALQDIDFIKKYSEEVITNRTYIRDELEKLSIVSYPSKANFIIANFGKACDNVCESLKKKNILVRNRSKYPLLNGCLRIGIGTRDQCDQFLLELKKILISLEK